MLMKNFSLSAVSVSLLLAASFLFVPQYSAFAGPPLLCYPIYIGDAKSLPSGAGPFGTDRSYNRVRLVEETLELLTPNMPVIVRMETLRRAALYATRNIGRHREGYTDEDRRIAFELLSRLMARTLGSEAKGTHNAMAWFDAGYLISCYEQVGILKGLPGYEFVLKASRIHGGNSELEFACALVTAWPKNDQHQSHLRKARADVREGSLLAANLDLHFGKN